MPRRATSATGSRRHLVVLLHPDGVSTRRATRRERLLARLRVTRLDERLAAGEAPESDPLLALRAQRLARIGSRRELALSVLRLLAECEPRRSKLPAPPSLALTPRVAAAHDDLEQLVSSLLAPAPVSARGLAAASCLLRDGSGPLYRSECTEDLGVLVRRTIDALDPSSDWPS